MRSGHKMSKEIVLAIDLALWNLGARWQRGTQMRLGELVPGLRRVREPSLTR